jgi:predicted HTH transcriptional regulator
MLMPGWVADLQQGRESLLPPPEPGPAPPPEPAGTHPVQRSTANVSTSGTRGSRNRRVGEFLKELHLAETRGTGVPKVFRAMEQNGSPPPRFDFDESRSYFRVTLPAHPEYVAISALRDAAYLRALGDLEGALQRIQRALEEPPASSTMSAALIEEEARLQSELAKR